MKTLDLNRMAEFKGGDYCATLQMIVENNDLSYGAMVGAAEGAATAGCAGVNEWDWGLQ